jgi:hypothetical protein
MGEFSEMNFTRKRKETKINTKGEKETSLQSTGVCFQLNRGLATDGPKLKTSS